ncbi:MAG: prenyltransferase/squalene oxidase repeat-containing protein, partial [Bryobacteraceae bacterium]|nr:prenyltransferase/squalene oxidase repeat-containing protein [Bryobacteraceae bacterium]
GAEIPRKGGLTQFLHKYPVPETRRTVRPLWTLDFQQVQALQWLGADISAFRDLAAKWTAPSAFEARYEAGQNPVLQFQSAAVRTRRMLGIDTAQPAWKTYFAARRRANGTWNNTPAADGSDGHVMNTLWGLLATEAIGESTAANGTRLLPWILACQRPTGGFTWAPDPQQGAIEDAGYTWAALSILKKLGAEPHDRAKAIEWLEGLRAGDGLWRETADGRPNPMGTFYVLESMALLGHVPTALVRGPAIKRRSGIPDGLRVWTMQIEAPGKGSPEEAVTVADTAGIHIWAAKNSDPGWIPAAQAIADRRKVNVKFAVGNEEYNTFTAVAGFGDYSHLVDLCAPANTKIGEPLNPKIHHPWERLRDRRIPALKAGGGRMVWQFNENEELTRILLDEAVEKKTYAALCTFHFGNENFLHTQPHLHRFYGRLPFVALADAHHAESWWSFEQTTGFRTLFIAKEPTWENWLAALDRDWVMGVRRDAVTKFVLRHAGGLPEVRDFVNQRAADWQWWDNANPWPKRPMASLVVLTPASKFEAGAPKDGRAIRLRIAANHTPQGQPRDPLADLVTLTINGATVQPEAIETKGPQGTVTDRYYIAQLPPTGDATAVVKLRNRATKVESEITLKS